MGPLGVCAALVADFFRHHRLLPDQVVEIEFLGEGQVRWVEERSDLYHFGAFSPVSTVADLKAKVSAIRERQPQNFKPDEQPELEEAAF